MTAPTGLTWEQYAALCAPVSADRIARDPRGNSHLEQWDVRRHLIRIFGFGGWDFELLESTLVKEIQHPPRRRKDRNDQEYGDPYTPWTVLYRVTGRLTIHPQGAVLAVYEDGATGDSENQPSLGGAHDQAFKTAISQALKRCAVNLGDQFGLSLYADTQKAVVLSSLVAPKAPLTKEPKPDGTS